MFIVCLQIRRKYIKHSPSRTAILFLLRGTSLAVALSKQTTVPGRCRCVCRAQTILVCSQKLLIPLTISSSSLSGSLVYFSLSGAMYLFSCKLSLSFLSFLFSLRHPRQMQRLSGVSLCLFLFSKTKATGKTDRFVCVGTTNFPRPSPAKYRRRR